MKTTIGRTLLATLACGLAASPALSLEGGKSVYPMGAENYLVGALPPPGTYFASYTLYYSADRFNGGTGARLFPTFKLNTIVEAPRLVHTFETPVLGATPVIAVLMPFAHQYVGVPGASGTGNGPFEVDSTQGLGWHLSPTTHIALAVDEMIPIGNYDPSQVGQLPLNHAAIEPIVAFTYHDPKGIDVSLKAMYDFNLRNGATNYTSGQDFHVDYAVGYNIDQWTVGVGGYYEKQTTNDVQNGAVVGPDGFKIQGFALGPNIQYQFDHDLVRFKWQHEFVAQNKPQGEQFWMTAVFPLGGGEPPHPVVARY